ncbi:MAG: hypothetical protein EBY03_07945, partial [Actinobacteria bacterium]|nr:hypothetical protein [Actinomycetota bacterium]
IANRVLENVITPFLVLHDELGEPTGLISLADGIVHDYSNGQLSTYEADEELKSLVEEFRDELNLATTEFDETAYSQGLIVPAIPFIPSKQIGRSEIFDQSSIIAGETPDFALTTSAHASRFSKSFGICEELVTAITCEVPKLRSLATISGCELGCPAIIQRG